MFISAKRGSSDACLTNMNNIIRRYNQQKKNYDHLIKNRSISHSHNSQRMFLFIHTHAFYCIVGSRVITYFMEKLKRN